MKLLKIAIISITSLFFISILTVIVAFFILNLRTINLKDDIKNIYTDDKYKTSYKVNNVTVFKQEISCGYAVIEMFSKWNNNNSITEKSLYDKYGKVVTETGKSFAEEMNKQFPEYQTTIYKYLKNSELIDKVYESLKNGIPVPFEWAAKLNNEWTLHYSLVTGIDIPNDKITVANPYGYIEELKIEEFLDRTTFKAFENMPIFLKFAFAFGFFEKNTIFIPERK